MDVKKVEQLLSLLEQWTRAESMARHGPLHNVKDMDYAWIKIEKEDEIRRLLYGMDDLVVLGVEWGMLKGVEKKKR